MLAFCNAFITCFLLLVITAHRIRYERNKKSLLRTNWKGTKSIRVTTLILQKYSCNTFLRTNIRVPCNVGWRRGLLILLSTRFLERISLFCHYLLPPAAGSLWMSDKQGVVLINEFRWTIFFFTKNYYRPAISNVKHFLWNYKSMKINRKWGEHEFEWQNRRN